MRKVYATVTLKIIALVDDDADANETLSRMVDDAMFQQEFIDDAQVENIEITDSK